MDIHNIREMLRVKSIYDIELTVTFYARVSSDSDEQINSLDNQVQYYVDLISNNPKWTYVTGYIDEGLSGMSTKKRENFNRMVEDATTGKFDMVITKEISRFARNTLDSIQYTRQLLSYGVGVFFQNDNINTFDDDSELRLSIMSSIAQDELRKLSSRIKFGHQQAIKNNVVMGNSLIFGYRKDNKRLVIDPEEAEMVKQLFELYSTDEYSMKQIETIFWEKGYRNHKGNKIAHSTMSGIISNPKYKGYYAGNKVKIVDMFTKKQKFLPPEEWVMFKDETGDIVPAIVSEELWERANEILKRRSDDIKRRKGLCNHPNLLTGKMFCTNCGAPYYRQDSKDTKGNKKSKWICSGKLKNGSQSCPSFAIYEDEIKPLLFEVFQNTKKASSALIAEYEKMYNSLMNDGSITKNLDKEEKRLDMAQKKKTKLLELVVNGNITDSDFKEMTDQCNKEIEAAEAEIAELNKNRDSNEEFRSHMENIRSALRKAELSVADGTITKEFVDNFIDKIYVTPTTAGKGETALKLDIRIFTGESTEKFLQKLKVKTKASPSEETKPLTLSTGHTFKKMCPVQSVTYDRECRHVDHHKKQFTYKAFLGI